MRDDLIATLIAELAPMDPAGLCAANRQHALTLGEFDAAAAATAPPEALADLEADPAMLAWLEGTAGNPADDGGLHLVALVATGADGIALDLAAMQQRYADRMASYPQTDPRAVLLTEVRTHVAQHCATLEPRSQARQIRLAANAIVLRHGTAATSQAARPITLKEVAGIGSRL